VVKKRRYGQDQSHQYVKSEPSVHGLAIEPYGIQTIVNVGKPKIIEFKADKAGISPIICQLHPTHVGTQLVVLE
jgi:nitrosocyanin